MAPNSPLRDVVTAMAAAPAQVAAVPAESATTRTTDQKAGHAGATAAGPANTPEPKQASAPPKRTAHYLWAVLIARIYEVFPLVCPNCDGPVHIIAFITHSADIPDFEMDQRINW